MSVEGEGTEDTAPDSVYAHRPESYMQSLVQVWRVSVSVSVFLGFEECVSVFCVFEG